MYYAGSAYELVHEILILIAWATSEDSDKPRAYAQFLLECSLLALTKYGRRRKFRPKVIALVSMDV